MHRLGGRGSTRSRKWLHAVLRTPSRTSMNANSDAPNPDCNDETRSQEPLLETWKLQRCHVVDLQTSPSVVYVYSSGKTTSLHETLKGLSIFSHPNACCNAHLPHQPVSPPDLPSRFPRNGLNYLRFSGRLLGLLQRLPLLLKYFAVCTRPHCTALRQFLPHRVCTLRSLVGLLLLPLQIRF